MNFRGRSRRDRALVAIDITSLMDVVFLLLIFLLVTTVFRTEEHAFEIEFPTSSSDQVVVNTNKTTIYVDKLGNLHLLVVDEESSSAKEPERLKPGQLRARLRELHRAKPDMSIAIKGDKAASYQAMVEVVGYVQDAGFRSVSFPYEFGQNPETKRP